MLWVGRKGLRQSSEDSAGAETGQTRPILLRLLAPKMLQLRQLVAPAADIELAANRGLEHGEGLEVERGDGVLAATKILSAKQSSVAAYSIFH